MHKNQHLKLSKYLNAIRSHVTHCVECSAVATDIAHYSGLHSDKLGKGRGCKAHDYAVARLCRECHTKLDNYESGNDEDRVYDFLSLIYATAHALEQSMDNTVGGKDKNHGLIAKIIRRELSWQLEYFRSGNSDMPIIALADMRDEIEVLAK